MSSKSATAQIIPFTKLVVDPIPRSNKLSIRACPDVIQNLAMSWLLGRVSTDYLSFVSRPDIADLSFIVDIAGKNIVRTRLADLDRMDVRQVSNWLFNQPKPPTMPCAYRFDYESLHTPSINVLICPFLVKDHPLYFCAVFP